MLALLFSKDHRWCALIVNEWIILRSMQQLEGGGILSIDELPARHGCVCEEKKDNLDAPIFLEGMDPQFRACNFSENMTKVGWTF